VTICNFINFDKLNINLGQTYAKRCIFPKIFRKSGPITRSSPWVYADSSERSTRHSTDSTAGQLVTTRCFSRRSTRHTILGCDELTVWRVDWQPSEHTEGKAHTAGFWTLACSQIRRRKTPLTIAVTQSSKYKERPRNGTGWNP